MGSFFSPVAAAWQFLETFADIWVEAIPKERKDLWRFVVPSQKWIEHLLPALLMLQVHIPSSKNCAEVGMGAPTPGPTDRGLSAVRNGLGPDI